MPRLWTQTIEAHRREVREAILDTTSALAAEQGLLAITMSEIAEKTGIGRATLYKYFPDVEAILGAWHERQIAEHFRYLTEVRDKLTDPGQRLKAVLEAFALLSLEFHGHGDAEFAALLHQGKHVMHAQHRLHGMVEDLLAQLAKTGDIRDDIAPTELATYCLHALTAAGSLESKGAIKRLVEITVSGLRPTD